eukprot:967296_1
MCLCAIHSGHGRNTAMNSNWSQSQWSPSDEEHPKIQNIGNVHDITQPSVYSSPSMISKLIIIVIHFIIIITIWWIVTMNQKPSSLQTHLFRKLTISVLTRTVSRLSHSRDIIYTIQMPCYHWHDSVFQHHNIYKHKQ